MDSSIKYEYRILKRAYISELEMHNAGGQSWAGFIVSLLKLIKFDDLWDKPDPLEAQKQSKTLKHKGRSSYKIYTLTITLQQLANIVNLGHT